MIDNGHAGSFADFPSSFSGQLFRPGDSGYAEARKIFNCITDDEDPALIVRCANEEDVVIAAGYASARGEPIAVRSGGHSSDASAMPGGALVIDLSAMTQITVDVAGRTARAQAGVLLGDFDAATQAHGLATTAGTVSTTGLAGLTLGGGVGYLMRRYGATVDNLLACDVVTVDGRRVRASEQENPELFWGLRGAGHNLGIVTAFEYRLHEVGPEVVNGLIIYPLDQAAEVFAGVREIMKDASRDLMVHACLLPLPPLPPIPAEAHGMPVAILIATFCGDLEQADSAIAPLASLGQPLANVIEHKSYLEAQALLNVLAPPGRRMFARGAHMSELSDEAVAVAIGRSAAPPAPTGPGPSSAIIFWCLGGALDDVDEDAMAFSREGASWMWEAIGQWDPADKDAEFKAWVDGVLGDLAPYSRANGYVNLTVDQGPDWLAGLYGSPAKYERLVKLKTEWDPDNLLRFNKNILPVREAAPV